MNVDPCRICQSTNLKTYSRSDLGVKWITCDDCGNHSTPIYPKGRDDVIKQWNKEQFSDDKPHHMTPVETFEYVFATIEYDYRIHPDAAKAIRKLAQQLYLDAKREPS